MPAVPITAVKTRRQLPATFRALRHRNYLIWFIGQGTSLIGSWMQVMAQQVLVYRLTGSAAALGIVNIMGFIPLIPLSLWGGSFIDRFSKRTVILWMQIGMMAEAILLAALSWTNTVQVWHVYVLSFFLGIFNAVDVPARQAFTVELVEGKEDLANAIGLNSAMFNGARALGPAVAGLLVAATGEGTAFFINGLTFLAVIAGLLMMKNLPGAPAQANQRVRTLQHMVEGIRYTLSQRLLMVLMSLIAVSAFLSMPYTTLMPVFAEKILGKSAQPVVQLICGGEKPLLNCQAPEALPLGMLLTTVGVGALLGALFVASLPSSARYGRWLTAGNILFPLLLVIVALSTSFLFSLILLLMVGISFVLQNSLANTLLQMAVPDALRGRVMSLYTMTFQSFMRLGGLQAGLMGDWIGPQLTVGLGAVLSLIFGVFVLVKYPEVRRQ